MEYWSNYNHIIDFSHESFLLYNSFTNAFIELPIKIKDDIKRFKNDRDSNVFDKKTRLLLKKTLPEQYNKSMFLLEMQEEETEELKAALKPVLKYNLAYFQERINQRFEKKQ